MMQPLARCRLSLSALQASEQWFTGTRHYATARPPRNDRPTYTSPPPKIFPGSRALRARAPAKPRPAAAPKTITVDAAAIERVRDIFVAQAPTWSSRAHVFDRLQSFGIHSKDVSPLLSRFVKAIKAGEGFRPDAYEKEDLARVVTAILDGERAGPIDQALTRLLFAWAQDPAVRTSLAPALTPSSLENMSTLFEATDLRYPAEVHPQARQMRRRLIMHVGPTNSGKTHNALRALAAARTGVYAGPLRLLAHEIWDRLNKGQIMPLGVEAPPAPADVDDTSGTDLGDGAPTASRSTHTSWRRPCNLITGEEMRIVDEGAGLISCTVEMLSSTNVYDVGVIDEIQLIKSEDRGGAWTAAVLGLCAKEIHLCGEETAVPIIEDLVRDTGDELIVNRYQRLTPLQVADRSLEGDFKNVRKGDCIATFKRTNIFHVKEQVENQTGMRCAVAYGRLPPELRSKQAALFNNPNSGYDVIVGSDAIGLGLNLKINRVIFESVHKYNGETTVQLPNALIKQIAGRAGRFGLQGDSAAGGVVTCLNEEDMPILRQAMAAPLDTQREARLHLHEFNVDQTLRALPPGATLGTALDAIHHLGRTRAPYTFGLDMRERQTAHFIDTHANELTLKERMTLMNAPLTLRDPVLAEVAKEVVSMYRTRFVVEIRELLEKFKLKEVLVELYERMEREKGGHAGDSYLPELTPEACVKKMHQLEQLHKTLTMHVWYAYRNPTAFPDMAYAEAMKDQCEEAMKWALEKVVSHKLQRERAGMPPRGLEDEQGEEIAYQKHRKRTTGTAVKLTR